MSDAHRSSNLVSRLRAQLIAVPKPGAEPRQTAYGETLTFTVGGEQKVGGDAGLRTLPQYTTSAYGPPLVQPHVYVVEPLCEEAAAEIERLQSALKTLYADWRLIGGDADSERGRATRQALAGAAVETEGKQT